MARCGPGAAAAGPGPEDLVLLRISVPTRRAFRSASRGAGRGRAAVRPADNAGVKKMNRVLYMQHDFFLFIFFKVGGSEI